jgi:hypothetical protein
LPFQRYRTGEGDGALGGIGAVAATTGQYQEKRKKKKEKNWGMGVGFHGFFLLFLKKKE